MAQLRLKKEALKHRADLAYYQAKPFDGLAYTLVGDAVTKIDIYQRGRLTGPYQDPYVTVPEDSLRLRYESLTPRYDDFAEPWFYQSQRFSGLVYEFDGDYCVGQYLIDAGEACQILAWLKDGTLTDYHHLRERFQEYANCYASGLIQHLKLDMKDHFSLELKLTEDQALSTFILTGDFFEHAAQVKRDYFFFPVGSIEAMSTWPAAQRLFLAGSAVDDGVFLQLQAQGGFQSLQNLCLYQTCISGHEIQQLTKYPQLQRLEIVEKGSELKAIAENIRDLRPDLHVDYEGAA